MTDITTISAALGEFACEVQAALALIYAPTPPSPAVEPDHLVPVFDQQHSLTPRQPIQVGFRHEDCQGQSPLKAVRRQAADAIFAAERLYSTRCLAIVARSEPAAALVIESRAAGDAVLRFAASAFCAFVPLHSADLTVEKLQKLADYVGSGNADGRQSSELAPGLTAPLVPRISPLG